MRLFGLGVVAYVSLVVKLFSIFYNGEVELDIFRWFHLIFLLDVNTL
jgi:hypothetical protein